MVPCASLQETTRVRHWIGLESGRLTACACCGMRLDLFGCAAHANAEVVLIHDHAYPMLEGLPNLEYCTRHPPGLLHWLEELEGVSQVFAMRRLDRIYHTVNLVALKDAEEAEGVLQRDLPLNTFYIRRRLPSI